MTPERRNALREIMTLAWWKFRWERTGRAPVTFADALRHAWEWVKGEAARVAAKARWDAAPAKRVVYLRSPGVSPISRSLRGQAYAGRKAWDAGRVTTSLGR
jgi:hypothetical protein